MISHTLGFVRSLSVVVSHGRVRTSSFKFMIIYFLTLNLAGWVEFSNWYEKLSFMIPLTGTFWQSVWVTGLLSTKLCVQFPIRKNFLIGAKRWGPWFFSFIWQRARITGNFSPNYINISDWEEFFQELGSVEFSDWCEKLRTMVLKSFITMCLPESHDKGPVSVG